MVGTYFRRRPVAATIFPVGAERGGADELLATEVNPRAVAGGPPGGLVASMMAVQRSAGNRAVAQLLQNRAPRRDAAELEGEAPSLALPAVEAPAEAPPSRIGEEVVAATVEGQPTIDAAVAHAGAELDGAADRQEAGLRKAFSQQAAAVDRSVKTMAAAVRTSSAARSAAVAASAAQTTAAVRTSGATAKVAANATIGGLAAEAAGTGQQEANRATTSASAHVAAARPKAGVGEPEVAEGKRRIADDVTAKARRELSAAGARTAQAVRSGVGELRQKLYGPAGAKAAEQVASVVASTTRATQQGLGAARSGIERTARGSVAMGERASREIRRAVQAGERQALADVRAWTRSGHARIAAAADQMKHSILQQARAFAAQVGQGPLPRRRAAQVGSEVKAGVRAAVDATRANVQQATAGAAQGMGELATGHAAAVGQVGPAATAGFQRSGQAAVAAQAQTAAAFTAHATAASGGVSGELSQLPARASAALAPEHQRRTGDLRNLVDDADSRQAAWSGDARSRGEAGTGRFDAEANRLGDAASSRSSVESVQRWSFGGLIASARSWLRENLGDVLGGIISGILLSLPAIVIGVGLLLAGPVGWGVLAGLLVVGAGLGIYGRFRDYSHDHGGRSPSVLQGLGLVGLGIADITGIPYIVEGLAGQRAFAPTTMNRFESWERGTQGVIGLGLLIAGGAKKLFGEGPRAEVPIEPRPVEVRPGEVRPGEVTPAEPPPEVVPATDVPNTQVPGPRTVTAGELSTLQAIADRFNTTLYIVGSRAKGLGRNVETQLPARKGPGSKSDIDVVIDGQVDIDTRGGLSGAVSGACDGAANVASSMGRPYGPHITISPRGSSPGGGQSGTLPADRPTIPPGRD